MTGKIVLVSGAGGFVGRWSVPPLIARGYQVHAVLSPAAGRDVAARDALPEALRGAVLHVADLLDSDAIEPLVRAVKPSHLLHFAWIATPGVYTTSADNYRWLAASRQLTHSFHANGGVRVVMAGSCMEYDWSRVGVCREDASPLADDAGAAVAGAAVLPYAECKLAMERALESFGRTRGLSTACGRIFFLFGPDEHPQRLVASVIANLLAGREARCSHGRQVRSFLHVADVGSAFAALLDHDSEGPVNIGSEQRLSVAELLALIASQIGRPELIRLGARDLAATEPALLIPDIARLRDAVGWRPRFDLHDGIADTIDWWRQRMAGGAARRG